MIDTKQEQIDAARLALGDYNEPNQTFEHCIKNMHMQVERLRKNIIEANEEIASMRKLTSKYNLSI